MDAISQHLYVVSMVHMDAISHLFSLIYVCVLYG